MIENSDGLVHTVWEGCDLMTLHKEWNSLYCFILVIMQIRPNLIHTVYFQLLFCGQHL
jgi:hypothetical protein